MTMDYETVVSDIFQIYVMTNVAIIEIHAQAIAAGNNGIRSCLECEKGRQQKQGLFNGGLHRAPPPRFLTRLLKDSTSAACNGSLSPVPVPGVPDAGPSS